MEVNIKALNKLLKEKFNNNQTFFAQEVGIDRTHVNL